jgi:hypothetical protein
MTHLVEDRGADSDLGADVGRGRIGRARPGQHADLADRGNLGRLPQDFPVARRQFVDIFKHLAGLDACQHRGLYRVIPGGLCI